jgi:UDP-glucose 4-epimerase
MRTILVTGAAGFVGSHVCDRLLADGERVIGVDDLSRGRASNLAGARAHGRSFTFRAVDIRSAELREIFNVYSPQIVMHLAAQASVSLSVADPVIDASLNVIGLLNVLECAASVGCRKVVFAASGGTLYGAPRKLPVSESARRNLGRVSPYAISKAVAIEYLGFYRRNRGLDFTALALSNVYGPRQDPFGEAGVVSIFSAKMLKGETPTIFGHGKQTRDYVFVADVADAFRLAATRGPGAIVNIGTGVETSVNRVYRLLAGITGFRGAPRHGPWREGDLSRSSLDVGLAARVLEWRPRTRLAEGLRATVDSMRR